MKKLFIISLFVSLTCFSSVDTYARYDGCCEIKVMVNKKVIATLCKNIYLNSKCIVKGTNPTYIGTANFDTWPGVSDRIRCVKQNTVNWSALPKSVKDDVEATLKKLPKDQNVTEGTCQDVGK